MLASRADVYTIRCSCKQWPCTYTAPCVARTCWEESQTHIAAPLWQRRSTHPARALMHAANAPRRGRSCTDRQHHTPPQHRQQNAQHHPHTYDQTARRHPGHTQHTPTQPRSDTQPPTLEAVQHPQPHTIRPPDSTKARPTIKPDRLFLFPAAHQPRRMSTETRCTLAFPMGKAGSSSLDTATGSTSARSDGTGIASPSRCAARK